MADSLQSILTQVGLAMAPEHGMSPQELMRHADIALYQGKNNGRDRAMFFSAEMAEEVEQRREVEIDLHAAIEAKSLKLYYQPLIGCADGRITGVEALLRWKHPTRGDIPASVFVPVAEEAGLMPALGAFVIEHAFEEAHELDIGLDSAAAVNRATGVCFALGAVSYLSLTAVGFYAAFRVVVVKIALRIHSETVGSP